MALMSNMQYGQQVPMQPTGYQPMPGQAPYPTQPQYPLAPQPGQSWGAPQVQTQMQGGMIPLQGGQQPGIDQAAANQIISMLMGGPYGR